MKSKATTALSPATKAWMTTVESTFDLEPSAVRLLRLAGEAWDRKEEAREVLARDGIVVEGREGVKTHPAVAVERDAAARFASLIKQLGLSDEIDPPVVGRPTSSTRFADFNGQDKN